MKTKNPLSLLLFLLLILNSCASGNSGIKIEEAWARPAAAGENTAIYLHITSQDLDDAWLEVIAIQADRAELHRSRMQTDGTIKMELQKQIDLPRGETIELAPGGLHVMLFNLKQSLRPGDVVSLTLIFQVHEKVNLDVPVKNP